MKVAWIGLGKLGYVSAFAAASAGHEVVGFDSDPAAMTFEPRKFIEAGPDGKGNFNDSLKNDGWMRTGSKALQFSSTGGSLSFASSAAEAVKDAQIVFIAVQTPHDPRYEGTTPLPMNRVDFDYSQLRQAVSSIAHHVSPTAIVAVISTVLPGTCRREVLPLLHAGQSFVYNPSFIAMGTTWRDYVNPEYVLLGSDKDDLGTALSDFYHQICGGAVSVRYMKLESAELTKVAYNTAITRKLGLAHYLIHLSHLVGANASEVIGALEAATRRVASGLYLNPDSVGDGGGCHPRDNIAMSFLARRVGAYADPFEFEMMMRQRHTEWLADLVESNLKQLRLSEPLARARIVGYAYKPNCGLKIGSAALLVANILRARQVDLELVDHLVDPDQEPLGNLEVPRVILVGTLHQRYIEEGISAPCGSIIIDPFRAIDPQPGVKLIALGETFDAA